MNRPSTLALLCVLVSLSILAGGCRTGQDVAARDGDGAAMPGDQGTAGPTLVVMVVVDQLRPDMLARYDPFFTGGFRRLLRQGYRFPNSTHDHAGTFTAPGHTTLATGVYPTRHGIVSNEWWEWRDTVWQEVYAVSDPDQPILGYPQLPGRSPANMYRAGLADWIADADSDARIVSISRKDRSAIGLAGRVRGDVYWMVDPLARFITSSYYGSEYPAWITRFNERVMPGVFADTVWWSGVPPEAARLSRPDTSDYETGGRRAVFPYRARDAVDVTDLMALTTWRAGTPAPDAAVLALAEEALSERRLGRRGVVDYLAVSFSQTDRIGHWYGPFSREQLDNLLRLDAVLGELFAALDRAVGPTGWVAAFSSDHGILEVPEHLAEKGVDARRLGRDELAEFRRTVTDAVGGGASGEALEWTLKAALETLPFVARAYTSSEVLDPRARPDTFAVLFAHSWSRERAVSLPARYGVAYRLQPNYLSWTGDATTHGTPYYYDRSVPIIFLGAGVPAGVSAGPAATVDVAPTLARLAGIRAPDDLDGRALFEPQER